LVILEILNPDSLGEDGGIAISISVNDDGSRHVGLLHSFQDSGRVEMLDLGWHFILRNEEAEPGTFLVRTNIGVRAQLQIAAYCRLIWRMNGSDSIPYGFGSTQHALNKAGIYLPGETGEGLTCATFVLAVFDAKRIPLVEYLTWPSNRPDDHQWQQKIVTLLERPRSAASEEHIEAARKGIGNLRYRPEEVAAAATVAPPQAHFNAVDPVARQILAELASAS
jgi:hypothetical protein